jgi:hypothetical protein
MATVNTQLEVVELAELYMPGSFMDESSTVEVNGRTIEQIARTADISVFAVRTFKVLEGTAQVGDKTVKVRSERFDVSPQAFVGGDVFTLEEVKTQFPQHSTLISNMEGNGWNRVIRARTGNWKPYEGEAVLAVR